MNEQAWADLPAGDYAAQRQDARISELEAENAALRNELGAAHFVRSKIEHAKCDAERDALRADLAALKGRTCKTCLHMSLFNGEQTCDRTANNYSCATFGFTCGAWAAKEGA